MKRRELKKNINFLCGELLAESVALLHYKKEVNSNDVDNIMLCILNMQNDLIARLSHVEPGSKRAFFKKLRQDMIDSTDSIVAQIKELA